MGNELKFEKINDTPGYGMFHHATWKKIWIVLPGDK
jgi:hypothetical protein